MAESKKKSNGGQKFMADLLVAAQSKEAMLSLAAETIRKSDEGYIEYAKRGIPESSTALNMRATFIYAKMNAKMNEQMCAINHKDLSTDQRLILIKQRYQQLGFGNFDADFKKAYPREFGAKLYTNNVYVNRQASISL